MRAVLKVLAMAVVVAVITSAAFLAGFGTSWFLQAQGRPAAAAGEPEEFRVFWEAWRIIEREFYGEVPTAQEMTYGAIRGAIKALDDPNTVFMDPQMSELASTDLKGKFEGIGAIVTMRDGQLIVVAPMEGQPAEKAGIRAGDIIIKVDDTEIVDMSLTEAVLLIRGPKGTKVRLTILRFGEPEPLVFEVVRGEIETPTVTWRLLEFKIGYIRVALFGERTNAELREAIQELKQKGARALILDLRNSPGGYLRSSIQVSSQFIESGVIVYESWNDGRERAFRAARGGLATEIPLAVLINQGTASAGEIVAGAIQDHERGLLIGERTFGKGWVQHVHQLSDGSTLHVTVAQWLTPSRQQISDEGIAPDIEVPLTEEDIEAGRDPQLQRAVEVLRSQS
ncbi:MAG TPA: S41 family peptidase [Anaerolineae bacterium]|nr:S41 family peptidase [Anaerolineae bacterium]